MISKEYRDHIGRRISRLKAELDAELNQRTISRNTVFREYANGRVLVAEAMTTRLTSDYLRQTHGSGADIDALIDDLNRELDDLNDYQLSGLMVARGFRGKNSKSPVFILVYVWE